MYMRSRGFYCQSIFLSLSSPLFRVIKRCARHVWLRWTYPWLLMACGTLRACGRRATFSAPPSAHPPATRSATFSQSTPMATWPIFPFSSCSCPPQHSDLWLSRSFRFCSQDAAGIKVGVAGRINDWLNKTPETSKTPGGRPVVGYKRWQSLCMPLRILC